EFPYLCDDYSEDPRGDRDLHRRFGIGSAVSVPIKDARDRTVGFFELHRSGEPDPFTWQDVTFLESLANTTAVAIDKARLLDELEVKSARIRNLSAENVNRWEEERRHIARELHDEAGQALVGIRLGLEVMARRLTGEAASVREQIGDLGRQVDQATRQIKDLAQRLRPPTLDRLGLDTALQQLAEEYSERTGLRVELSLASMPERLPAAVETSFFRIAQEALTNVVSHAEASRARLCLEADVEQIVLTIDDDGRGFSLETITPGLGLLGMQERVDMLGGDFRVESDAGRGTRIRVVLAQSTSEEAGTCGETAT
ncbi:MAG: GAF domain-containing sensor histidine kinase, partial [Holophagales bacterium]|nr:GAF domain-containing sensor histidine kinase [Holophagales bacterium]